MEEAARSVDSVLKKRKISKKSKQIIFIILLIIFVVLFGIFMFQKRQGNSLPQKGNLTQTQFDSLLKEIGDKMVLPTGEVPQIATVTDVTKLSGQSFFLHAQNGDKVVMYKDAQMAILFRPSIHKIIAVAPYNAPTQTVSIPKPTVVRAMPAVTATPDLIATPSSNVTASPTAAIRVR